MKRIILIIAVLFSLSLLYGQVGTSISRSVNGLQVEVENTNSGDDSFAQFRAISNLDSLVIKVLQDNAANDRGGVVGYINSSTQLDIDAFNGDNIYIRSGDADFLFNSSGTLMIESNYFAYDDKQVTSLEGDGLKIIGNELQADFSDLSISDIDSVHVSSSATDDLLEFDGNNWVNVNNISDEILRGTAGTVPWYGSDSIIDGVSPGASNTFLKSSGSGTSDKPVFSTIQLSTLTDVNVAGVSDPSVLAYSGGGWIDVADESYDTIDLWDIDTSLTVTTQDIILGDGSTAADWKIDASSGDLIFYKYDSGWQEMYKIH